MNRKARSLGAALLAVALLVGALPTTGITAAAPSPAVGTTLLAGTTLVTGAGSGVFPSGAVWGGVALSGGSFGQGMAVFGSGTARGDFQMILPGTNGNVEVPAEKNELLQLFPGLVKVTLN